MKHNRNPKDGLVVVLRNAGVKLGTAKDDKLTSEDALFFFAACIEPLGGSTGTKNSIDFEFYSNERGGHGYVFGIYASKADLEYIYAGYTFDFMHIYPARWANKYPAHLRAIPVNAKLKHTTKQK
jgi:hypothetical protein